MLPAKVNGSNAMIDDARTAWSGIDASKGDIHAIDSAAFPGAA